MSRVKIFSGLPELWRRFTENNSSADEELNKEEAELLAKANRMSKERIDELKRKFSGEISVKGGKNKDIVPTVETNKIASKKNDKSKVKDEADRERE